MQQLVALTWRSASLAETLASVMRAWSLREMKSCGLVVISLMPYCFSLASISLTYGTQLKDVVLTPC